MEGAEEVGWEVRVVGLEAEGAVAMKSWQHRHRPVM